MLLVDVEVRPSPIHGLGVFTREPISKGKIVWQFDPGMDRRHPASWLEHQPPHVRKFVEIYGVLSLDKQSYYLAGDQTSFVNHAADPNLVPRDELLVNDEGVVVAARDIAPGEELTIDYGSIDGGEREKQDKGAPLFAVELSKSKATTS
jgi:SET domain-containing protein